ncbi:hypothetical protein FACS1894105_00430 [Clostridia bacterium]|nr:hypothetical protein FACS1894105_00430 [Clostridia bacterium]
MKNAINNIWKIIKYPLLYIGMQVAMTFLYSMVLGGMVGVEMATSGEILAPEAITEKIQAIYDARIAIIMSSCATLFVIFLILRKEWKQDKTFTFAKIEILPLLLCILLGASLNGFTISILSMLPSLPQQPIDGMVGNNIVLEIISLGLITAFLEEIIFRGIVLKRLLKITKLPVAIILQAFIFALIHFNLLQSSYAFVLGIVLGIVCVYFGSVWFAFVLHAVYNITSILIQNLAGESDVNLLVFAAASGVILAMSIISMVNLIKKKANDNANNSDVLL